MPEAVPQSSGVPCTAVDLELNHDASPAPGKDVVHRVARCRCGCPCCMKVCGCICVSFVFLIVLAVIIFKCFAASPCGVSLYSPELVVPQAAREAGRVEPVTVGTADNMNTDIPLDFTGVWWIRWTERRYWWYNMLRIEELATFAGMETNTTQSPWFPARLSIPTGRSYHWGFTNTLPSMIGLIVKGSSNPYGFMHADFVNATHGKFDAPTFAGQKLEWRADKIDDDQWLRTTVIESSGKEVPYTLTRVIFANGTAHPTYFPLFLKHMRGARLFGSWDLNVYDTDDVCKRQCYDTVFASCSKCEEKCRAK